MRVCRWSSKRGWMKSVGRCFLRRSRQLRWEYWAGWVRSWQSQVFLVWRHIRISKRLRELGLRVALGAQRKQILKAALGPAFRLLAFGSAAGLMLGMLASRVLSDNRVSGDSARSSGVGRSRSRYGDPRVGGYLDSSAAGAERGSDDIAEGRVKEERALIVENRRVTT